MDNDLTRAVFGNGLNSVIALKEALEILDELNLINHGELTELAISEQSGVERCEKLTENIDLVTGKQIKYAKTYKKSGGRYVATISRKTTAPMLLVVNNTRRNKLYFFHIPYSAHRHLTGNTISISFDPYGSPANCQWFDYQVKDFDTLCQLAKK